MPQEHFTDTGGASDHVFGLFALIGKRFAPRLRNLKDRKFHTFEKGDPYPALSDHIGVPINATLILDHWDDLLRLAATDHDAICRAGIVTLTSWELASIAQTPTMSTSRDPVYRRHRFPPEVISYGRVKHSISGFH